MTTVQWTVSGYLLALGAGLAATAYLARRFGTLPVYRASVVAFTAASALCALAPGAAVLVGARVAQGLVAAPLVPLAMSMLLGGSGNARSISPLAGIMLFLGPALGPTVGGVLIGAGGWRAIFLINVPFGALAALAVRFVPPALAPGRTPGTCRSVSIGLIINPLLQALTQPLRPEQLGDANTLFNAWQRIAGSFGIGLLAALYATQARVHGPVAALHLAGVVLGSIAAAGALAALALPRLRNTALSQA